MECKQPQKSQAEKFREAAKVAETDDDEVRFDERLKQIVKTPADAAEEGKKVDSQ